MIEYIISHTGEKGGPYESKWGGYGTTTPDLAEAARFNLDEPSFDPNYDADDVLLSVKSHYPKAKFIKLVKRQRHKCALCNK